MIPQVRAAYRDVWLCALCEGPSTAASYPLCDECTEVAFPAGKVVTGDTNETRKQ